MGSKTNNDCAYLMLDVGGTFIKSGVLTRTGTLYPGSCFSEPVDSDGMKEEIVASITGVLEKGTSLIGSSGLRLCGVGIAIPGPFGYAEGVPKMEHKFRSIYGLPLRDVIYSVPGIGGDVPVVFMHDVNAVLAGEMSHGNAEGFRNTAIVTLGTGLGFSFTRDGEVQCSGMGSPAMPIYDRPYGEGILEDYVSKRGFLKIYGEITGDVPEGLTVAGIGVLAGEGDKNALGTFKTVGTILAGAVRSILLEQDIECFLLGGQISRSFRFMEASLRDGLAGLPALKKIDVVQNIGEAAFYGLLNRIVAAAE